MYNYAKIMHKILLQKILSTPRENVPEKLDYKPL